MNMILHYEYVQVFLVHFNAKTFARLQLLHKYLNVCLITVQNIFLNLSCISYVSEHRSAHEPENLKVILI